MNAPQTRVTSHTTILPPAMSCCAADYQSLYNQLRDNFYWYLWGFSTPEEAASAGYGDLNRMDRDQVYYYQGSYYRDFNDLSGESWAQSGNCSAYGYWNNSTRRLEATVYYDDGENWGECGTICVPLQTPAAIMVQVPRVHIWRDFVVTKPEGVTGWDWHTGSRQWYAKEGWSGGGYYTRPGGVDYATSPPRDPVEPGYYGFGEIDALDYLHGLGGGYPVGSDGPPHTPYTPEDLPIQAGMVWTITTATSWTFPAGTYRVVPSPVGDGPGRCVTGGWPAYQYSESYWYVVDGVVYQVTGGDGTFVLAAETTLAIRIKITHTGPESSHNRYHCPMHYTWCEKKLLVHPYDYS